MINRKGPRSIIQNLGLISGILLFFIFININLIPDNIPASRMAAVAFIMAIWWMTEAVPLAVTALLPIIIFPFLGILDSKLVATQYFNSTIILFLGGIIIAVAIESWGLHKRISLHIIKIIGGGQKALIFGFMLASALVSMFINNTATAVMMFPIGYAIILQLEEKYDKDLVKGFSVALMLGIGYSCSIGGVGTLVGTAPNLIFQRIFQMNFPNGPQITFSNWLPIGFSISILMLIASWFILTKLFIKKGSKLQIDKNFVKEEYLKLGKSIFEEKVLLIILLITGFLWIFRLELNLGFVIIPGWSNFFGIEKLVDDGTVVIFMVLLLFIIPSKTKPNSTILDNKLFKKIPWDIVLLFGGGFALAEGFQQTGLSKVVGEQLSVIGNIHPLIMIIIICTILTFLTELTSNTATAQTLLPIIAALSVTLEINPLLLMIPATISASFAFMLPVATPPNAIIFSSGKVTIKEMMKAGIFLNLTGIIIVSLIMYFIGSSIFGFDPNIFPKWEK
ncbi:MAG: SLC13 family permease [Candidatus Kapabacteria bacterium]|nr:SLC13 family permease [Candidatus Kapabacteria bacterium]